MGIHSFHSRIRYSECGEDGRLNLGSIVNYFQDTCTFHGEDHGVGVRYLKEHHQAWILSFWQIVIEDLPVIGTPVTTQTWAADFQSFYGHRNFVMLAGDTRKDSCCSRIAYANSIWVLMDTVTQRPVKVPQSMQDAYGGTEPKLDMDYAPRKIPEIRDGAEHMHFTVERHHLDTNHHVNNGQYIEMMRTFIPDGFGIREARVEYKMQAHLGDVIVPVVKEENDCICISLRNEAGRSYALGQFFKQML